MYIQSYNLIYTVCIVFHLPAQSELVLPDSSSEEVRFLMEKINANEQLNTTAFYWIGQTSRFQLSIPHSGTAKINRP